MCVYAPCRSIVAALVTNSHGADVGRLVDYWFLGLSAGCFVVYHVLMAWRLQHWYSTLDARTPPRAPRSVARVPLADDIVPVFRLTGHKRRTSTAAGGGRRPGHGLAAATGDACGSTAAGAGASAGDGGQEIDTSNLRARNSTRTLVHGDVDSKAGPESASNSQLKPSAIAS